MLRPETIKLIEDNIGRTLFDINHSNFFMDLSPMVKEIRSEINKYARGRRYGDICICIADSLCYKAETNTPL